MSDKTLKQKQQRQDKEKQAYAFYVAQGWTPEQSIGIIGNIKRESGFNPNAIGDAGKAFGLAQWHPDRQAKAKSLYGNNWKSFENQLKFIDWELKNTEKVAGDKLKKTKGVWQAGQVVSDFYERPKVKFSGDETRQTYVADLAMKFKGVKLTPEDMPYFDASYANSVAPYMNQPQETITPTLNYFNIPKETTTFASVPDSAKEDKKETVEDGVTSKDVAEVETKTKEYNFLEELQKEDYSHLQPEQVAQQQIVPQVDFNQQYEQVSQFIDEPLVAQSGGMINFYKEYINSPNYKKRLITQGYTNPEQVKKDRLSNLNKITQSEINDIGSQYYHRLNKVNIDNKELKKHNFNKETTTAHEYSHGVGAMNTGNSEFAKNLTLNTKETNLINSKNNYLDIDTSYKNKKLTEDQRASIEHNSVPSEAKADIDALRFKLKKAGLYDTSTQQFNQDILNKAKKMFSKDTMINRNFKAFDDKDLIWIMNNIAQNESDTDNTTQVAQQGLTWQEKLANRPKKPTVAEIIAEGDARKAQQRAQTDNIPNTKRDLSLMLAEHNNIKKDEQELRTTGQIKNPKSIQYRRNVKTQPDIKQDDISTEQRNAQLNPLERPLIYLANPSKLLGDIGIPNMETSELDRQAISSNRFNPNQTRTQRLENQVKLGLGYVPEATVNTALAASFMPEGSGALGLINETLNPLAGLKTSIPDSMKQGLNSQGFLDMFKNKPKFNIKDDHFYRSIGIDDAVSSGTIRSKQIGDYAGKNPYFVEGTDFNKLYSTGAGATSNKPEYIFEMPMVDKSGETMTANRVNQSSGYSPYVADKNQIPLSEGYIYKLNNKGEYEVFNTPKTTQNFKSEINWGQWNKEIPENTNLLNEYNTIEQTSKADGSWMKNTDGSTFQGTPEQFVQQNSENFKKAFSGKVNKQYHTTDKNFEVFDTTKSPSKGIFFTPDKEYSEKFTKIYKPSDEVSNTGEYYLNVNKPLNVDDPISHTTVSHYYNQRPFAAGKYDAIQGKEMDILGGKSDINVTTVFSPNQIKSAIGNSGMFDMNNPNIYKSVVPIAGASYLATQGQNKQQGGKQNYTENELAFLSEIQGIPVSSRGMYDYPNQEVIVPTNGSITMKGIPHKIKAKSLETGEEKILKPNREYYFKNTKNVLEIPFFKK